jgi:hypothetical protein
MVDLSSVFDRILGMFLNAMEGRSKAYYHV